MLRLCQPCDNKKRLSAISVVRASRPTFLPQPAAWARTPMPRFQHEWRRAGFHQARLGLTKQRGAASAQEHWLSIANRMIVVFRSAKESTFAERKATLCISLVRQYARAMRLHRFDQSTRVSSMRPSAQTATAGRLTRGELDAVLRSRVQILR